MRPGSKRDQEAATDAPLTGHLADARAAVLAREDARRREELAPGGRKPRADALWVAIASASWLLVAVALISS